MHPNRQNGEDSSPADPNPDRRYRQLFEGDRDGILLLDGGTGQIVDANPVLLSLLGSSRDQLLGKRLWEIGIFKDGGLAVSAVEKLLREGYVRHDSLPLRTGDGRKLLLEFVGNVYESGPGKACQCRVRDVTDRRRFQERMIETQKMEAVGQLAAGAAHGYNNILTATLLQLGLLLDDVTLPNGVKNLLRQLEGDANRAAELTRQLLTFSRRQTIHRRPLDLVELLHRQVRSLQHLMAESIAVELAAGHDALWIDADVRMIEQVVTNLGLNARDAMMPRGGSMTIGASLVEVDDSAVRLNPEARLGSFACLSVSDTGRGMDPQTLRQSFEPFFTTKEEGKGIGLGLSVVYGIAKQHDGWVEGSSEVGRGSTFRVYFPLVPKMPAAVPEPVVAGVPKGNETILVVEDEATVRSMIMLGLQLSGYRVLGVGSGEEALKVWNDHATEIDLLFTDMRMGGMSGIELYDQLKRKKNALRVIISSGYSEEILRADVHTGMGVTFLPKPYGIMTLGVTVRQCLDQR